MKFNLILTWESTDDVSVLEVVPLNGVLVHQGKGHLIQSLQVNRQNKLETNSVTIFRLACE